MKAFLIMTFILSCIYASGQERYTQKVYAYYEHGKTARSEDKRHFVFIETPSDSFPVWQKATINGMKYDVHFEAISNASYKVGERAADKRMVVLTPAPGNKLWQLYFDLVTPSTVAETKEQAAVLLEGLLKGRKILYRINKETELTPIVLD